MRALLIWHWFITDCWWCLYAVWDCMRVHWSMMSSSCLIHIVVVVVENLLTLLLWCIDYYWLASLIDEEDIYVAVAMSWYLQKVLCWCWLIFNMLLISPIILLYLMACDVEGLHFYVDENSTEILVEVLKVDMCYHVLYFYCWWMSCICHYWMYWSCLKESICVCIWIAMNHHCPIFGALVMKRPML